MVAPQVVFGIPASPAWLVQRARAEAAKAPPPSPQLAARLANHMDWVITAAPLSVAS